MLKVYERTGATEALATGTAPASLSSYPYLARAASHIGAVLELDETTSARAMLALTPTLEPTRDIYLASVVGDDNAATAAQLLDHIKATLTPTQQARIHAELATALGTVH